MMDSLDGKVALVTGASRGIGRAISPELARAGADLVLTSASDNGADETCREVTALKRRAISLSCEGLTPKMTAEDVAAVVRYLCADAPQAMNGSLVEVFG